MSNGGRTVLHWAARNGHLSVVKVLVGAGADKERRRQTKKVTVAQKAEYWGVSKRRMEQALWLEKNHPFLFDLWWGAPVTWHKDEWTDRFDRIIRLRGLVSCAQRILRAEGTGDERQMGAAYRAACVRVRDAYGRTPRGRAQGHTDVVEYFDSLADDDDE